MTTVKSCEYVPYEHIHLDGMCEFEMERLEMEGKLPMYDEEDDD